MAVTYDKETGDWVINGWEKGVSPSPHQGIANIQGANISTETGEIMVSFARVQQSQPVNTATGTLTFKDSTHVTPSVVTIQGGIWITTTGSTISGLSNTDYYVLSYSVSAGIQLATTYNGAAITGLGNSGTASFTLKKNMGKPIAKATETYSDGTNLQYRYYVLDANGLVWVLDSAVSTAGVSWFLPDTTNFTNPTGLAVLNGWLHLFYGNTITCKPTSLLGATPGWTAFNPGIMMSLAGSPNPHFAFVGHQGSLYYTDGNFIGKIFPNSVLSNTALSANIQSYASYTAATTTGTVATLIGGSIPAPSVGTARVPAVFFTAGTLPSALSAGVMYFIAWNNGASTFQVFAAATGGAALDIQTGSAGTQYFNTYYPTSSGGAASITFTPQKLALPFFEVAQCLVEVGDQVLVGCKGNVVYPWDQFSSVPNNLIPLPESNVVWMITVSNMCYMGAGNKGNIYMTNGAAAAAAITVPDYCAGIAGTPASYIEPYFTWGDAMFLRGRVYFSILDQTSSKTGNCGGIWSFIPTQNFFFGQDVGLALRLENQNSYGTYNGVATVLIPSQNQAALSPQYWSGWYSDVTTPTYGIDNTGTTPSTTALIETDLIPWGTMLQKETPTEIEYKLAAPLVSGDSVSIQYRINATDAYASLGTLVQEATTGALSVSGYYVANFQNVQWVQFLITLTAANSASSSFTRLSEVRFR